MGEKKKSRDQIQQNGPKKQNNKAWYNISKNRITQRHPHESTFGGIVLRTDSTLTSKKNK
jgi:hypothetical protein